MKFRAIRIAISAVAAGCGLLWWLTGPHTWWSPEFSFQVVDEVSGVPISGAVVVVTWDATQYESSYRKTLSIEEGVSDSEGYVVVKKWGPRVTLVGGLKSTEPVVRIAHRMYAVKILRQEQRTKWARSSVRVPWNGVVIPMKRATPRDSASYWLSAANLFMSLESQLIGKHCEWKGMPRMLALLGEIKSEYESSNEITGVAALLSFRGPGNSQRCGKAQGWKQ